MSNVAVIGCGVIGLTSAVAIQNRLKNVKVTIFTEDKTPNTTGDVAAGYWKPYLLGETSPDKVNEWSKVTYDYILNLWKEGKAEEAGISLQLSRYATDKQELETPSWKHVVLGFSELSRDYLDKVGKLYRMNFTAGYEYVTFIWEASVFLPFLEQAFLKNGGRIVTKTITSFDELNDFDVIVNCAGLGAKELTGDEKMHPVRGQVARVVAPWQFHTFLIESEHNASCYVIPNRDCVILGGTSQPAYDTEVNEADKRNIFRNCSRLIPALAGVEVIKHQVGLRPGREEVRLEIEIKRGGKTGPLGIVHNYGHGGSGITLCVGCAEDCAKLVEDLCQNRTVRNKL